MSYRVTIEIVCDADECYERLEYSQINQGGLSKTWAGHRAATAGWQIPGVAGSHDPKRALCPMHRTKIEGELLP